ncbi:MULTISPECIES: tyrosine-type recombinase/integrase [unclassified Campylobacter]|uniref:tyrosine-type recombinase/integrase n=1 Tax=unclassified Campylobacter TaxID=2593542 RepID=UPI003D32F684
MATFFKEIELKNFKIPKDKKRVWLKDQSTPFLYVFVALNQNGTTTKTFYYRYTIKGDPKRKINQITIGKYPFITLAEARAKANELTTQKERGNNIKVLSQRPDKVTFEAVANKWIEKERSKGLSDFNRSVKRIEQYLMPYLQDKDIRELKRIDFIYTIEKIQEAESKKGITHDTSKRVFWLLRKIMDYALMLDYVDRNYTREIIFVDAFKTSKTTNYRAITEPKKLSELIKAFNNYQGSHHTKQALIFGLHTFLRSANIRGLKWDFVDFDNNRIVFPAETMKLKSDFVLMMSKQVSRLLREQQQYANGAYVFPSDISKQKPLSENTLNYAIKRLGFNDDMVFHGIRATASTLLNEMMNAHGFDSELIELCLDHKERNKIKATYDRSQRLNDRGKLWQWWSDYLDELESRY